MCGYFFAQVHLSGSCLHDVLMADVRTCSPSGRNVLREALAGEGFHSAQMCSCMDRLRRVTK